MKTYNRALDYTALALNALAEDKNPVMAARLLAKAAQQTDVQAAIATLEASNKHAFALQAAAKKTQAAAPARLKASEEIFEEEGDDEGTEDEMEAAFGEDDDPLADLGGEEEEAVEEAPAETMAKVLSSMARRSGKR